MLCIKIYVKNTYNIFLYVLSVLYLHLNSVRNYSEPEKNPTLFIDNRVPTFMYLTWVIFCFYPLRK